MPNITGTITQNDSVKTTYYSDTALTSTQTFSFTEEQDAMTFTSKGSSILTLTVAGKTYKIPPYASINIDDDNFTSFDVISLSTSQSFEVNSHIKLNKVRSLGLQLADKASKSDIQNISKGSPSGVYATLSALQTAFPTGNTNVYVVTADGKWYYWNGSAWTVGGVYQATGLADGSITSSKTSFITDVITSKNLFDKNTRTEGYYLIAATGATAVNASYFYSDYIKVTPNTSYVGRWSNTIGIICYYDTNKVYISGHGISADDMVFTTPANTAYIRVSNTISRLPDFRINLGTTLFPYDEITVKYKFDKGFYNGFVYVAKDGTGDFTSVTQAVASVSSGTTIIVKPGIYDNEEVQAWGKTVYIIGTAKQDCIIQNATGDYDHPPLEMSSGLLKNLTIIANSYVGGTPPSLPAYALHVEDNYMQGKNLSIENCRLESYCNYALGMGMRGGCKVEIKNSDLVGKNSHGGLFFHDASNATYAGVQTVRVINTNIFANDGTTTVLRMDSQQTVGTTVNVEFINCNVRNLATGAQDKIFSNVGGSWVNTIPELTNFNLSKGSWGNNLTVLNTY